MKDVLSHTSSFFVAAATTSDIELCCPGMLFDE